MTELLSNQQALNQSYRGLMEQGCPAYDGATCRYRLYSEKLKLKPELEPIATTVLKCGIGWLIPDTLYDPDIERRDIIDLIEDSQKMANLFFFIDITLLRRIRAIHDSTVDLAWVGNAKFKFYITKEFAELATEYGLALEPL